MSDVTPRSFQPRGLWPLRNLRLKSTLKSILCRANALSLFDSAHRQYGCTHANAVFRLPPTSSRGTGKNIRLGHLFFWGKDHTCILFAFFDFCLLCVVFLCILVLPAGFFAGTATRAPRASGQTKSRRQRGLRCPGGSGGGLTPPNISSGPPPVLFSVRRSDPGWFTAAWASPFPLPSPSPTSCSSSARASMTH